MDLHNEFENSRYFNQARFDRRTSDVMVGVAIGLIGDGPVTQAEAVFLLAWLETNMVHMNDPVVNLLYDRLSNMLAGGVLSPDDATTLMTMLEQFAGIDLVTSKPNLDMSASQLDTPAVATAPNRLPLNHPAPDVEFSGKTFLFTGSMAYGPRSACQELVTARGAECAKGVSRKVDYLVVGSVGNDQWLHSSYGTKIIAAVELRESGHPIAIIGEDHFFDVLLERDKDR